VLVPQEGFACGLIDEHVLSLRVMARGGHGPGVLSL
jgi:hypothetical protein